MLGRSSEGLWAASASTAAARRARRPCLLPMRFPNGMVNKRQLFSSLLWRRKQLQTFTPEDVAVSEREKHAENNVCFEALERDLHRYFSLLRQHEGKEGQQAYLTGSLRQELGFSFAVRNSVLSSPKAGYGLFLNGHLSKGRVACMYPGVIYRPGDPMLLFTFANRFFFCYSSLTGKHSERSLHHTATQCFVRMERCLMASQPVFHATCIAPWHNAMGSLFIVLERRGKKKQEGVPIAIFPGWMLHSLRKKTKWKSLPGIRLLWAT
ncbi:SET domain-containing protein 9 [Balamuthia mandrillaris]